jgi:hypothetical protein
MARKSEKSAQSTTAHNFSQHIDLIDKNKTIKFQGNIKLEIKAFAQDLN